MRTLCHPPDSFKLVPECPGPDGSVMYISKVGERSEMFTLPGSAKPTLNVYVDCIKFELRQLAMERQREQIYEATVTRYRQ